MVVKVWTILIRSESGSSSPFYKSKVIGDQPAPVLKLFYTFFLLLSHRTSAKYIEVPILYYPCGCLILCMGEFFIRGFFCGGIFRGRFTAVGFSRMDFSGENSPCENSL